MILTIFNWLGTLRPGTDAYGTARCSFQVLLITVLIPLSIWLSAPQFAVAENGSEFLMRQWADKKQQIKAYILRDLKQQGIILPKDGHVFLEAVVKRNPHERNTFDYELRRLEKSVDNGQDCQKEIIDNQTIYNTTNTAVSHQSVLLKGTIKLNGPKLPKEYFKKESIHIGPMPNVDPDNL